MPCTRLCPTAKTPRGDHVETSKQRKSPPWVSKRQHAQDPDSSQLRYRLEAQAAPASTHADYRLGRKALALVSLGHTLVSTPASDDLKRCTKCEEEKPLAEFSRARSRKDGRAAHCKACVRRWKQENAEHLADYHRRWQQANRDKKRAQDGRCERKRQDPDYWERRRANDRRRNRERRAEDAL